MPKRKRVKKYEEDIEHLMHKIRKLERKIRSYSDSASSHNGSICEDFVLEESAPSFRPDDWYPELPDDEVVHDPLTQFDRTQDKENPIDDQHIPVEDQSIPVEGQSKPDEAPQSTQSVSTNSDAAPIASTSTAEPIVDNKITGESSVDLTEDILQILGDDPSSTVKYGKDLRKELASRFEHIVTEGITKEIRKDLIAKYPIPANCVRIDAPKLNLEIKAAINENFAKRDKGIETKQKEMACAISCLGEIISSLLNSKDKNNDLLQKLMDLSRILCDMQHADSVTRRNFILFTLKKDLKEHIVNTKIDTSLFGENLSETLKTAKAVNKSGAEMKPAATKQAPAQSRRPGSSVSRPLNRRGLAARRPPLGPPPPAPAPAPRGRAPAPRAPPHPPPPPARYYRPSYSHQPQQRRY